MVGLEHSTHPTKLATQGSVRRRQSVMYVLTSCLPTYRHGILTHMEIQQKTVATLRCRQVVHCIVCVATLSGCDPAKNSPPSSNRQATPQPATNTQPAVIQPVAIPIASIISTNGQDGLQVATSGTRMVDGKQEYASPFGEALQRFFEATKGQGASNVFLVDALNASAAITVSGSVFAGYRSADRPATLNQPNPPRGNNWLVVYIGISGSNPIRWLVDSVTVDSGTIRFNYHMNPIGGSTADIHYYYFWVPLGDLKKDVYNLELYETELKAVTLMRRVEVK